MWSYSGNPSDSARDKVRFLIGDTDNSDQQLSDEEVNAILADNGNEPYATAMALIEGLIARFSRYITKSVGDLSISYGDRVKQYQSLLTGLRRRASIQLCAPYAGGISVSDKEIDGADSDVVPSYFKVGMHDTELSED